MKQSVLFLGFCMAVSVLAHAQSPSLSPWQMNKGEGIVNLPAGVKSRKGPERLSIVYDYANIPQKKDPNWVPAPVQNNVVTFGSSSSSILDKSNYDKFTQVDFTYFRAFLDVPANFKVEKATVTIGQVDDQARMMIYNSANPDGAYVEANDGKRGGRDFVTDFTKYVVPGINTFKIIQVDDNCCGNTMTGSLSVKLNNAEIPVTSTWEAAHRTFMETLEYAPVASVGSTQKIGDEYILTPAQQQKNGGFWMESMIDLTKDFEIKAEINLGTSDGGADGLALVFQNKDKKQLGTGGSLGYQGISPSFSIEFDTYQNGEYNDPSGDHVGKRINGSPAHATNPTDYVEVANLEDGKFHPIVFTWQAQSKTFTVKLDDKTIFANDPAFPQALLNAKNVYFGFTAATGNAFNKQIVREVYFSLK